MDGVEKLLSIILSRKEGVLDTKLKYLEKNRGKGVSIHTKYVS